MLQTRLNYIIELINHMTIVHDNHETDKLLQSLVAVRKPIVVSFINTHGLNLAWADQKVAELFRGSDILLRDGIGISLLMRLSGMDPGINMNGTDFIPIIIQVFSRRRVALCGTDTKYLKSAAAAVRKLGGEVVLTVNGFAEYEIYTREISSANADLVILGMGMPKQEKIASILVKELPNASVIVNGGAILDFLADRFPRAPVAWRRIGLEWLFRILQEPRRLWRRYVLGGICLGLIAAPVVLLCRYRRSRRK